MEEKTVANYWYEFAMGLLALCQENNLQAEVYKVLKQLDAGEEE